MRPKSLLLLLCIVVFYTQASGCAVAPQIIHFRARPVKFCKLPSSVIIEWIVNRWTTVTITRDPGGPIPDAVSGNPVQVADPETTFTLTATQAGSISQSIDVQQMTADEEANFGGQATCNSAGYFVLSTGVSEYEYQGDVVVKRLTNNSPFQITVYSPDGPFTELAARENCDERSERPECRQVLGTTAAGIWDITTAGPCDPGDPIGGDAEEKPIQLTAYVGCEE
jgi:hypothetical protein